MTRYLLRRAIFAVVLVFAVSSSALVLARLAPGDYATSSLGIDAKQEDVEQARARLGLDRPVVEQYVAWLARAARFDFGRSMAYDRPVAELVPERAKNTAVLALSALALATIVGLPLGVISGSRGRGFLAGTVRTISLALLSTPPLVMSLGLVAMAAATGWLPVGGMRSATAAPGVEGLVDLVWHLVVPVVALALPIAATFERLQSQSVSDALAAPFILATRARGASDSRVVWRSALRPALRPIVSVYGLVIGSLLSGSFAVEVITSWPGLGRLMLDALRARDVYLVAGCAAAGSACLAVGTMVSDALLVLVDPRAADHS